MCSYAVRSFTTDLGTEKGVADAAGKVEDDLPKWQTPQVCTFLHVDVPGPVHYA